MASDGSSYRILSDTSNVSGPLLGHDASVTPNLSIECNSVLQDGSSLSQSQVGERSFLERLKDIENSSDLSFVFSRGSLNNVKLKKKKRSQDAANHSNSSDKVSSIDSDLHTNESFSNSLDSAQLKYLKEQLNGTHDPYCNKPENVSKTPLNEIKYNSAFGDSLEYEDGASDSSQRPVKSSLRRSVRLSSKNNTPLHNKVVKRLTNVKRESKINNSFLNCSDSFETFSQGETKNEVIKRKSSVRFASNLYKNEQEHVEHIQKPLKSILCLSSVKPTHDTGKTNDSELKEVGKMGVQVNLGPMFGIDNVDGETSADVDITNSFGSSVVLDENMVEEIPAFEFAKPFKARTSVHFNFGSPKEPGSAKELSFNEQNNSLASDNNSICQLNEKLDAISPELRKSQQRLVKNRVSVHFKMDDSEMEESCAENENPKESSAFIDEKQVSILLDVSSPTGTDKPAESVGPLQDMSENSFYKLGRPSMNIQSQKSRVGSTSFKSRVSVHFALNESENDSSNGSLSTPNEQIQKIEDGGKESSTFHDGEDNPIASTLRMTEISRASGSFASTSLVEHSHDDSRASENSFYKLGRPSMNIQSQKLRVGSTPIKSRVSVHFALNESENKESSNRSLSSTNEQMQKIKDGEKESPPFHDEDNPVASTSRMAEISYASGSLASASLVEHSHNDSRSSENSSIQEIQTSFSSGKVKVLNNFDDGAEFPNDKHEEETVQTDNSIIQNDSMEESECIIDQREECSNLNDNRLEENFDKEEKHIIFEEQQRTTESSATSNRQNFSMEMTIGKNEKCSNTASPGLLDQNFEEPQRTSTESSATSEIQLDSMEMSVDKNEKCSNTSSPGLLDQNFEEPQRTSTESSATSEIQLDSMELTVEKNEKCSNTLSSGLEDKHISFADLSRDTNLDHNSLRNEEGPMDHTAPIPANESINLGAEDKMMLQKNLSTGESSEVDSHKQTISMKSLIDNDDTLPCDDKKIFKNDESENQSYIELNQRTPGANVTTDNDGSKTNNEYISEEFIADENKKDSFHNSSLSFDVSGIRPIDSGVPTENRSLKTDDMSFHENRLCNDLSINRSEKAGFDVTKSHSTSDFENLELTFDEIEKENSMENDDTLEKTDLSTVNTEKLSKTADNVEDCSLDLSLRLSMKGSLDHQLNVSESCSSVGAPQQPRKSILRRSSRYSSKSNSPIQHKNLKRLSKDRNSLKMSENMSNSCSSEKSKKKSIKRKSSVRFAANVCENEQGTVGNLGTPLKSILRRSSVNPINDVPEEISQSELGVKSTKTDSEVNLGTQIASDEIDVENSSKAELNTENDDCSQDSTLSFSLDVSDDTFLESETSVHDRNLKNEISGNISEKNDEEKDSHVTLVTENKEINLDKTENLSLLEDDKQETTDVPNDNESKLNITTDSTAKNDENCSLNLSLKDSLDQVNVSDLGVGVSQPRRSILRRSSRYSSKSNTPIQHDKVPKRLSKGKKNSKISERLTLDLSENELINKKRSIRFSSHSGIMENEEGEVGLSVNADGNLEANDSVQNVEAKIKLCKVDPQMPISRTEVSDGETTSADVDLTNISCSADENLVQEKTAKAKPKQRRSSVHFNFDSPKKSSGEEELSFYQRQSAMATNFNCTIQSDIQLNEIESNTGSPVLRKSDQRLKHRVSVHLKMDDSEIEDKDEFAGEKNQNEDPDDEVSGSKDTDEPNESVEPLLDWSSVSMLSEYFNSKVCRPSLNVPRQTPAAPGSLKNRVSVHFALNESEINDTSLSVSSMPKCSNTSSPGHLDQNVEEQQRTSTESSATSEIKLDSMEMTVDKNEKFSNISSPVLLDQNYEAQQRTSTESSATSERQLDSMELTVDKDEKCSNTSFAGLSDQNLEEQQRTSTESSATSERQIVSMELTVNKNEKCSTTSSYAHLDTSSDAEEMKESSQSSGFPKEKIIKNCKEQCSSNNLISKPSLSHTVITECVQSNESNQLPVEGNNLQHQLSKPHDYFTSYESLNESNLTPTKSLSINNSTTSAINEDKSLEDKHYLSSLSYSNSLCDFPDETLPSMNLSLSFSSVNSTLKEELLALGKDKRTPKKSLRISKHLEQGQNDSLRSLVLGKRSSEAVCFSEVSSKKLNDSQIEVVDTKVQELDKSSIISEKIVNPVEEGSECDTEESRHFSLHSYRKSLNSNSTMKNETRTSDRLPSSSLCLSETLSTVYSQDHTESDIQDSLARLSKDLSTSYSSQDLTERFNRESLCAKDLENRSNRITKKISVSFNLDETDRLDVTEIQGNKKMSMISENSFHGKSSISSHSLSSSRHTNLTYSDTNSSFHSSNRTVSDKNAHSSKDMSSEYSELNTTIIDTTLCKSTLQKRCVKDVSVSIDMDSTIQSDLSVASFQQSLSELSYSSNKASETLKNNSKSFQENSQLNNSCSNVSLKKRKISVHFGFGYPGSDECSDDEEPKDPSATKKENEPNFIDEHPFEANSFTEQNLSQSTKVNEGNCSEGSISTTLKEETKSDAADAPLNDQEILEAAGLTVSEKSTVGHNVEIEGEESAALPKTEIGLLSTEEPCVVSEPESANVASTSRKSRISKLNCTSVCSLSIRNLDSIDSEAKTFTSKTEAENVALKHVSVHFDNTTLRPSLSKTDGNLSDLEKSSNFCNKENELSDGKKNTGTPSVFEQQSMNISNVTSISPVTNEDKSKCKNSNNIDKGKHVSVHIAFDNTTLHPNEGNFTKFEESNGTSDQRNIEEAAANSSPDLKDDSLPPSSLEISNDNKKSTLKKIFPDGHLSHSADDTSVHPNMIEDKEFNKSAEILNGKLKDSECQGISYSVVSDQTKTSEENEETNCKGQRESTVSSGNNSNVSCSFNHETNKDESTAKTSDGKVSRKHVSVHMNLNDTSLYPNVTTASHFDHETNEDESTTKTSCTGQRESTVSSGNNSNVSSTFDHETNEGQSTAKTSDGKVSRKHVSVHMNLNDTSVHPNVTTISPFDHETNEGQSTAKTSDGKVSRKHVSVHMNLNDTSVHPNVTTISPFDHETNEDESTAKTSDGKVSGKHVSVHMNLNDTSVHPNFTTISLFDHETNEDESTAKTSDGKVSGKHVSVHMNLNDTSVHPNVTTISPFDHETNEDESTAKTSDGKVSGKHVSVHMNLNDTSVHPNVTTISPFDHETNEDESTAKTSDGKVSGKHVSVHMNLNDTSVHPNVTTISPFDHETNEDESTAKTSDGKVSGKHVSVHMNLNDTSVHPNVTTISPFHHETNEDELTAKTSDGKVSGKHVSVHMNLNDTSVHPNVTTISPFDHETNEDESTAKTSDGKVSGKHVSVHMNLNDTSVHPNVTTISPFDHETNEDESTAKTSDGKVSGKHVSVHMNLNDTSVHPNVTTISPFDHETNEDESTAKTSDGKVSGKHVSVHMNLNDTSVHPNVTTISPFDHETNEDESTAKTSDGKVSRKHVSVHMNLNDTSVHSKDGCVAHSDSGDSICKEDSSIHPTKIAGSSTRDSSERGTIKRTSGKDSDSASNENEVSEETTQRQSMPSLAETVANLKNTTFTLLESGIYNENKKSKVQNVSVHIDFDETAMQTTMSETQADLEANESDGEATNQEISVERNELSINTELSNVDNGSIVYAEHNQTKAQPNISGTTTELEKLYEAPLTNDTMACSKTSPINQKSDPKTSESSGVNVPKDVHLNFDSTNKETKTFEEIESSTISVSKIKNKRSTHSASETIPDLTAFNFSSSKLRKSSLGTNIKNSTSRKHVSVKFNFDNTSVQSTVLAQTGVDAENNESSEFFQGTVEADIIPKDSVNISSNDKSIHLSTEVGSEANSVPEITEKSVTFKENPQAVLENDFVTISEKAVEISTGSGVSLPKPAILVSLGQASSVELADGNSISPPLSSLEDSSSRRVTRNSKNRTLLSESKKKSGSKRKSETISKSPTRKRNRTSSELSNLIPLATEKEMCIELNKPSSQVEIDCVTNKKSENLAPQSVQRESIPETQSEENKNSNLENCASYQSSSSAFKEDGNKSNYNLRKSSLKTSKVSTTKKNVTFGNTVYLNASSPSQSPHALESKNNEPSTNLVKSDNESNKHVKPKDKSKSSFKRSRSQVEASHSTDESDGSPKRRRSDKSINELSYDTFLDLSEIPKDKTMFQKKIIYHSTPIHPVLERRRSEKKLSNVIPNDDISDKMIQVSKTDFASSTENNITKVNSKVYSPEEELEQRSKTNTSVYKRRSSRKLNVPSISTIYPSTSQIQQSSQDSVINSPASSYTDDKRNKNTVRFKLPVKFKNISALSKDMSSQRNSYEPSTSPSKSDISSRSYYSASYDSPQPSCSYVDENSVISESDRRPKRVDFREVSEGSEVPELKSSSLLGNASIQNVSAALKNKNGVAADHSLATPFDIEEPNGNDLPRSSSVISELPTLASDTTVLRNGLGFLIPKTAKKQIKPVNSSKTKKKTEFPDKWVHPHLLDNLSIILEATFAEESRAKAMCLIRHLCATVASVKSMNTYKDIELSTVVIRNFLSKYNICKNQLDYFLFLRKYTPFDFQRKVFPLNEPARRHLRLGDPIIMESEKMNVCL